MSNGPDAHWHVTTLQQRGDDTLLAYVEVDGSLAGQQVEVSVYLSQGDAYAAHYAKKRVPFLDPKDPGKPPELQVELPATSLDASEDVTVIARVAEVWPSVLQQDSTKLAAINAAIQHPDQGPKAVWTYAEGKAYGDQGSPSSGNVSGRVTTLPQQEPTA
jgi:hypothetical protein